MERHRAVVAKIAAAVRSFSDRQEPFRIFHGSTNSTRPAAAGARPSVVDISALSRVLSVDARARIALVEPNVPMDRLVEHTLPHGLVPPVVMEFPGITAGGGYAGSAAESSSFRHGFFDDAVRRVEMVLADGEVVDAAEAPAGPRPDLLRGAAGALGTLGVATLLELRLVRAKTYVRLRYRRTHSVADALRALRQEAARPDNDYVDGILFSRGHGVVVAGRLTDEKPPDVAAQTFSGAWDPWFYLHAKQKTATNDAASDDYVPLAEYLFRYDRGGFWVGEAAFDYFGGVVPFGRLARWFLDDFLHTRMLYRALHASGESARFVIQDVAVPFETAERFVDYTAREIAIWPLWLCPLRRRPPPTFHPFTTPPKEETPAETPPPAATSDPAPDLMLNVGVWGRAPGSSAADSVAANRALEMAVRKLGGAKCLYAHTYYPAREFWDMYGGRAWYDALRTKYRASGLPTVWDKVHVDPAAAAAGEPHWLKRRAPFGGLWGIWKSIQSRDYLIHRRSAWKWKGGK